MASLDLLITTNDLYASTNNGKSFLAELGVPQELIDKVLLIKDGVSFCKELRKMITDAVNDAAKKLSKGEIDQKKYDTIIEMSKMALDEIDIMKKLSELMIPEKSSSPPSKKAVKNNASTDSANK